MDRSIPEMFGGAPEEDFRKRTMKMKSSNKRRFSDEQIKSLESIFENEPKLEPRKKVEVARQLGLQPRQVAIWFQNKRARWKSRQLETDFSLLRSNYNALSSRFDSLTKDKYSLLLQLQQLKQLLGMSTRGGGQFEGETSNHIGNDKECETKGKQRGEAEELKPMEEGSEYGVSDESDNFPIDEATPAGLLPMVEPTSCSSLTSDEEWQSLQPQPVFDRSTTSCDWWDLPFVDHL